MSRSRTGAAAPAGRTSGAPEAVLLTTSSLEPTDVEAWERLAAAAAQPNPFFEPDFVLAAAEGRGEPAALLVVRAGRDWIACLPVERRAPWRSLPLPCLSPWLPAYAYLGDPLVDRDCIEDAVAAIA